MSDCSLMTYLDLRYNALSFVFLQVRELSWLQWHPFSVSSSPLDGKYHISVLIKVLGKWTEKLRGNILENSEELPFSPHSKITASVEGPYGHEIPYHLMYVLYSLILFITKIVVSDKANPGLITGLEFASEIHESLHDAVCHVCHMFT